MSDFRVHLVEPTAGGGKALQKLSTQTVSGSILKWL